MRISSRPRAALLLIVLVVLGALGGTFYAFRGRLAAAPFLSSVFGRAQVGAPAAGAASRQLPPVRMAQHPRRTREKPGPKSPSTRSGSN